MAPTIKLDNGKYTFHIPKDDYRIHVDRYDKKSWVIIEQACNAVCALMWAASDRVYRGVLSCYPADVTLSEVQQHICLKKLIKEYAHEGRTAHAYRFYCDQEGLDWLQSQEQRFTVELEQ